MVRDHEPEAPISYEMFFNDRNALLKISESGPLKSFSYQRLKLLEHRFDCYLQLNKAREMAQTTGDRMDWSKVAKVDTHIHLAAAFTSAQLFEFIEHKLEDHPEDIVALKDGKGLTLKDLFLSCDIDPHNLTMASLDKQAGRV
jgi:AMP deaminase